MIERSSRNAKTNNIGYEAAKIEWPGGVATYPFRSAYSAVTGCVFSSSDEEKDVKQAYTSGANSYLCKPIDFGQFAETVGQLGLYWLAINQPCPN